MSAAAISYGCTGTLPPLSSNGLFTRPGLEHLTDYRGSGDGLPTPTARGLYLRPELSKLVDYRLQGVEGVRARRGEQPDRVRVRLDREPLDGAAVPVERRADAVRLPSGPVDVISHGSSSLVDGRVLDTPADVANTVEAASDTTSLGLGGSTADEAGADVCGAHPHTLEAGE